MPAVPSSILEPLWDRFAALLPARAETHPLGCHRPRVPDRVVFDKLVRVLVFGCAYRRIADATVSATTRRRRDGWIAAGVMAALFEAALAADDRMIGLDLAELAVDGRVTKAPCGGEPAGRSPADRGRKRSAVVGGHGLPLGFVVAPAGRHDSPLLEPTLETLGRFAPFPDPPTVHPDRGDDYPGTPDRLARHGMVGAISPKGKPAPIAATGRWVVERTHARTNAHKKPAWCTQRRAAVVEFWPAFSAAIVVVGRLVREGWRRYRRDGRPERKP